MKIAHLMYQHKIFTQEILDFYQKNFKQYKFQYYIVQQDKSDSMIEINDEDTIILKRWEKEEYKNAMNQVLNEFDLVVFHSMFLEPVEKLNVLFTKKEIIQKIVWIEWGYDLYLSYPCNIKGMIKKLVNCTLRTLFDKKIPYFIAIHPADIAVYEKKVKGSADKFVAQYTGVVLTEEDIQQCRKIQMSQKKEEGKPIVIQIGHRAERLLRHKDVLYKLRKYRNENIKLILPLSYGEKKYGDAIEELAKKLFGEKAMCLREVIPYEEYLNLLEEVDIFLINTTRQIALGNIHPMILNEKKIYMPEKSVLYNYYCSLGFPICKIESIDKQGYELLSQDVDMRRAREHMIEYKLQNPIKMWDEIWEKIIKIHGMKVLTSEPK